jgi:flagellar biosynthesis protein FlhF
MQVKVFHAFTMQEAIQSIKAELGPEAVILSTKDIRQKGPVARWFGRPLIEVTAAIERRESPADAPLPPSGKSIPLVHRDLTSDPALVPVSRFQETLRGLTHDAPPPKLTPKRAAASPGALLKELRRAPISPPRLARVRDELRGLHQHLLEAYPEDAVATPKNVPGPMTALYRDFVTRSLAVPTAVSFVQGLHDQLSGNERRDLATVRTALRELMKREMTEGVPLAAAEDDKKVGVFFGPSGSGKTTVIAKLAATLLEQGRTVALLCMDVYRPSAVEQLRSYAAALELPFATAGTRQTAAERLRRLSDADTVLVDTGGRNIMDAGYMSDIRWLTTLDHVVETHLVLSATTREEDLSATVRRCAEYSVRRLLFTKLDESTGIGSLLNVHKQSGIPFSYFSTGPGVPHDLEVAGAERLADLLLEGTIREEQTTETRIAKVVGESMGFEPESMSA